jgi:hypothetical protein
VSIEYHGKDITVSCEDGRKVTIHPNDLTSYGDNIHRRLQDVKALIEGTCSLMCKDGKNN